MDRSLSLSLSLSDKSVILSHILLTAKASLTASRTAANAIYVVNLPFLLHCT